MSSFLYLTTEFQDASIIQVCQTSHVIRTIEFGRVDLANLVLLEAFDVSTSQDFDRNLVSISRVDETFKVTMSGLVRDPAGFLGVIRFGLELLLQLRRDNEPWGWIGIGSV